MAKRKGHTKTVHNKKEKDYSFTIDTSNPFGRIAFHRTTKTHTPKTVYKRNPKHKKGWKNYE